MMPYLYSMNAKAAIEGTPLVQPMYWDFPKHDEAYQVRNQFLFGSELLVMPITSPADPRLHLAKVRGWLPPGRYIDIFNGVVYDGNRELVVSRSLEGYPAFAREGSIIPLDAEAEPANGGENPSAFEVLVVVGADGSFDITEDNGTGTNAEEAKFTTTPITYTQSTGTVQIGPSQASAPSKSPATRDWCVRFLGSSVFESIKVIIDSSEIKAKGQKVSNGFLVQLGQVKDGSKVVVEVGKDPQLARNDVPALIFPFLHHAKLPFKVKEDIWEEVTAKRSKMIQVSSLSALDIDRNLLDAVLEYVLADSR
jgi:hypothetical protein